VGFVAAGHETVVLMPLPMIEPLSKRNEHGGIAVGPAEVTARYAFTIRPVTE
jgi:hypothetical protein